MAKLDLKKAMKHLYTASATKPSLLDIPEMAFLMIDGAGDPNNAPAFHEAIGALYGVAFTLKFGIKKSGGQDYTVMPLEGLWWMKGKGFDMERKDAWLWTLMIMQPDWVTPEQVTRSVEELRAKKDPPALSKLRFERFAEGRAAQILHIGPYSEEAPTIEKLRRFAEEQGYEFSGKHHEIYMGDPRRCAPEKLKTILRHPVRLVG